MTTEQIVLAEIKTLIRQLPTEDQEAINELADFIRMNCKRAGYPVGPLAVALVGAELQVEAEASK
jgi:hypothetical protein